MSLLSILALSVLFAVATAILACVIVRMLEPHFIFYPRKGLELTPASLWIDYEDVWIHSYGLRINGWFFPGEDSQRYIIFYHGNAGNMSDRLGFLKAITSFGPNVLMIDYRGYGKSEGRPSVNGVKLDAVAAIQWLMEARGTVPGNIVLWGQSLGAAMALHTAGRYPVAGVIVEAAFVSIRKAAGELFPNIPACLVSGEMDNSSIMSRLAVPKLVIHGACDEMIPSAHASELYRVSAKPKQLYIVPDAGHADTCHAGGEEYIKTIDHWLCGLPSGWAKDDVQ